MATQLNEMSQRTRTELTQMQDGIGWNIFEIEAELKKLDIHKGQYFFMGPDCGNRFRVKFTDKTAGLSKASDVARHVKTSSFTWHRTAT